MLGKMFTKKATRKHAERKDKRKHHVKHAIMPSVTGLKVGQLQFVSSSLSKANTAKWNADLFLSIMNPSPALVSAPCHWSA